MLPVIKFGAVHTRRRRWSSSEMETRARMCIDALRVLARSNDLNQVILVESNIDRYLKANAGHQAHALERLRNAIHEEEAAKRPGEDWSLARDYVRRLLHKMQSQT
jgi:hypothetical protein